MSKFKNKPHFTIPGRTQVAVDRELFDDLIMSIPTQKSTPIERIERMLNNLQNLIYQQGSELTHDDLNIYVHKESMHIRIVEYRRMLREATALSAAEPEVALDNV